MTKTFWDAVCIEPDEDLEDIDSSTVLLVDADIIAYQSAATADGRQYTIGGRNFKYHKDAIKYIEKHGLDKSKLELAYDPEPEINALHNVKNSIKALKSVYPGCKCEMFISGSLNFRNDFVKDYKQNREGCRRPEHLSACKQYILNKHKGKMTEGLEADDLIGIQATVLKKAGKKFIICTLDKDLDMIPGTHYNWRKNVEYDVDDTDAMRNFFLQCLMGDKTDNIYGLNGIGPVKAKKILDKCETDKPEDLWTTVVNAWWEHHPDEPKEEIYTKLLTSAKLLWILREPFVMFKQPVEVPIVSEKTKDKEEEEEA